MYSPRSAGDPVRPPPQGYRREVHTGDRFVQTHVNVDHPDQEVQFRSPAPARMTLANAVRFAARGASAASAETIAESEGSVAQLPVDRAGYPPDGTVRQLYPAMQAITSQFGASHSEPSDGYMSALADMRDELRNMRAEMLAEKTARQAAAAQC